MRRTTTAHSLWREPFPAYVVGNHFLRWVADRKLAGLVIWGAPSARDAAELVALLEAEMASVKPEADVIVDFRAAKAINAECFAAMRDHVARHGEFYAQTRDREALLRPPGLVGTIVSGFYEVVTKAHHRSSIFTSLDEALTWLDRTDARHTVTALANFASSRATAPPLLVRVRNELERRPRTTLVELAHQLHLSQRTLQHQLRKAGTTFRRERSAARLRRAKLLLETTNTSIGIVGLEVGCATPQHSSDWFRAITGDAPSTWRRRYLER